MNDSTNIIHQLDQHAQETLLALIACRGNKTQAAISLGVNRSTIYERIEKYGLDKALAAIPEKALLTLQAASERAAEVLSEELDSKKNRLSAAVEILDRVGLSGKKNEIHVGDKVIQIINYDSTV